MQKEEGGGGTCVVEVIDFLKMVEVEVVLLDIQLFLDLMEERKVVNLKMVEMVNLFYLKMVVVGVVLFDIYSWWRRERSQT